ncbi:hypothetical protein D9615_009413 [Tricholomella constricta]|uniref:Uncharacterized protein n=1 Tax=Tricholomella constricta TaxID=117010 RepID=A0A8H5M021_9AGAR|nr:hypothetical protein D9615_009413 [Tricholomella constricta]
MKVTAYSTRSYCKKQSALESSPTRPSATAQEVLVGRRRPSIAHSTTLPAYAPHPTKLQSRSASNSSQIPTIARKNLYKRKSTHSDTSTPARATT